MNWKKVVGNILKVVISGLAIYYVLSRIDLREIADKIKNANILLLLAALATYTASQLAAAFRLKVLFKRVPIDISHKENLKLYWLGLFYNLFLPGGVGGDGYKVYLIGKHLKRDIKSTIGAILSDRVSGLSVIVIFLLILIPLLDYNIPYKNWAWSAIPLVAAAFYLFLRLFNRRLLPAYFQVISWALVVQGLQMLAAVLILSSLDAEAKGFYDAYIFLFFLSSIAGSLPITLGGIGARELVFVWGAQYLSINAGSALALSLLFYTASALCALPGIVFTFRPSKILEKAEAKRAAFQ
ncbi:MAG: flippase-like domain-containing protein [Bacteroidales bacterium]|jgi:uncharacterized membrane protein YbhN (UPF0104 family)|nr:flippase-like domain-containing protein [Bacteroidales bacterium]